MINIHGLVRGENLEFGRDADTGGQTRYILELVRSLSEYAEVDRIDLVTRLIDDKVVHESYSLAREPLTEKASIVRLPCGGRKYIRKEMLWPHLAEFTDRLIHYIRSQNRIPDFVHGHYADAAYVANGISGLFGIPLLFTGHSLGKNKLSFLESTGMSEEKAHQRYSIRTRITAEESALAQADLVIASTNYEKDELYGFYDNHELPRYSVIPPGVDLEKFFPYYYYEIQNSEISEETKQAHFRTRRELERFLFDPQKPLILTLCRPDARKNIDTLIDVYGRDKELQAMANLAVYAGIRDDISTMEESEQQVLTDILLAMDKYDLYGRMAIPKYHRPDQDVPEMYRIAALSQGVFVSASFLETFGLTFIEASSCGLPFVATRKGGPVDIEANCQSGILADVENVDEIGSAIKKLLTDQKFWSQCSTNGINNTRSVYTWEHHCDTYIKELETLRGTGIGSSFVIENNNQKIGKVIHKLDEFLITDIDDTLLGDPAAVKPFLDYMKSQSSSLGFGVATGRDIDSARKVLEENGIDNVLFYISSVGSEIYYKDDSSPDEGWASHIEKKWKPESIRDVLSTLPFLSLQTSSQAQRKCKISYNLVDNYRMKDVIPVIHKELTARKLSYHLIHSHNSMVDVLPYRASKGKAIRYLSHKWNIPPHKIYTSGNSGNDADMLTGSIRGIVVGNHEPELDALKNRKLIYFSKQEYAAAIVDGLTYWKKKGVTKL
ncbi:MAG: HAD-IIB family hydrolase [Spirochaetales bacterium]|nr:HAD-IIB family hydrolase [Spirochaetales bacterium]